jgi:hypothetical protein
MKKYYSWFYMQEILQMYCNIDNDIVERCAMRLANRKIKSDYLLNL